MYVAPGSVLEGFFVPGLLIIGISTGSRRLLTYRRLRDEDVKEFRPARQAKQEEGSTANELNSFRKRVSSSYP